MINSRDISVLFHPTRRDAQARLPGLVRRLILASCGDGELEVFRMPDGDDVRVPGCDGRIRFSGTHPYIPFGDSVWEMGVSADARAKAEADYRKRTDGSIDCDRSRTTFVFVTPHVWEGRDKWVAAKRAENAWADVRVIDGTDLVAWLERQPTLAIELAEALGRSIRGLHSLDGYWDRAVAHRYSPTISPQLIIGGRKASSNQFVSFLRSSDRVLSIVGETVEEATLYAVAACRQDITEIHGENPSRVLVVSQSEATEHLTTLSQDHLVILTDPSLYPAVRSRATDHLKFVIPEKRDASPNTSRKAIELGSLVRERTEDALVAIGHPKDAAAKIAAESKGSLLAVFWMIAQPERGAFEWALGRSAAELAPLVLAGQWMVDEHPDHEIISQLAGRDHAEVRQTLAEWSGPGQPLERRGPIWDWKAWAFAWTRLAPSLQRSDVERFLKIANEVLGASDPALDLPQEDRWLANIRGKVHRYSSHLREGLVQSLVHLAMNGHVISGLNGQAVVDGFVRSLLQIPEPAKRWASLAPWLPDLAEASPDVFLDAADQIAENPEAIKEIFQPGGMFSSSPHTYLLWALERLAWSEDHFSRVTLVLGRLAEVDPGGNLANRPHNSLRMALLSWCPATGASVNQRLSALRVLFDHAEQAAWKCAVSLLPQSSDHGDPFNRPKWREWSRDIEIGVSHADYWAFHEGLVELLLAHAGSDGHRWATLLEAGMILHRKHPDLWTRIIDAVGSLDLAALSREGRVDLGEAARAILARHETYEDAEWSMKGESLELFRRLHERVAPELPRDRHRWLFRQWPEVIRERGLSMDECWRKLRTLRTDAVAAVIQHEGFERALDWSGDVDWPEALGETLAVLDLSSEEIASLLRRGFQEVGVAGSRPSLARLAYGYVAGRSRSLKNSPRDQPKLMPDGLSDAARAFYFQAMPTGPSTWDLVDQQGEAARDIYWREVAVHHLTLDECEAAASRLLSVNRPFTLIDLAAMIIHDAKANEFVADQHARLVAISRLALDAKIDHLPREEHAVNAGFVSHEIDELLDYMEKQGTPQQDLAGWEWKWLPFLQHEARGFKSLQAELCEDPSLFVELLKCVFRADADRGSDVKREFTVEEQSRARMAWVVLDAWTRIPGLGPNAQANNLERHGEGMGPVVPAWTGAVDGEVLKEWVAKAVELATAADRRETCWSRLGHLLAYCPARNDGVWPCREVCEVIERSRSEVLEDSMRAETTNRRSAHWVAPGGAQETALGKQFREWCEQTRSEYPRTGRMLRTLAEFYEAEAKRAIESERLSEYE